MSDTFTFIPAEPGWKLAEFLVDGLVYTPIIGWMVEALRASWRVLPVTVAGVTEQQYQEAGRISWVARMPDGTFADAHGSTYSTEDEVIEEFKPRRESA